MKQLLIIISFLFCGSLFSQNCGAITHSGQPCKNKVKVEGQKCWMHGGERKETKPKQASQQCTAMTLKGVQCKRMTTELNGKCFMHQNK